MKDADKLDMIEARVKLLREECHRDTHEHADSKPVYALLRMYSKMKMFCEFFDTLHNGPVAVCARCKSPDHHVSDCEESA